MAKYVHVYTYPVELTPEDTLSDGDEGAQIEITEDTVLIWVDLDPESKFVHPTHYVLISPSGTRVEEGLWWPVLNGKRVLYGSCSPIAVRLVPTTRS